MIITDNCLEIDQRTGRLPVSIVEVDGERFRIAGNADAPAKVLAPPCVGAAKQSYEFRGIEVARVTHCADDGEPLSWAPLCRHESAIVLIASGFARSA